MMAGARDVCVSSSVSGFLHVLEGFGMCYTAVSLRSQAALRPVTLLFHTPSC